MIMTAIIDVSEINKKKQLTILNFKEYDLPQKGDNIIIDDNIYVVQRREYNVIQTGKSIDAYSIGLQVKKYIPEKYGF